MPQVCTKIKTSLHYQHIFKATKYATSRELFPRLFSKPESSHPFGGGGGSKSFKTPPPREARTSEQLGGKKTQKEKKKKKRKIYQYANQQETRQ
jgi:hypothetical protein